MIHIERTGKPEELTDDVVKQKTELYKNDHSKTVWKEKYIYDALMAMSYNKCCYCECLLNEESKYMEIEHFHDKSSYPEEVENGKIFCQVVKNAIQQKEPMIP